MENVTAAANSGNSCETLDEAALQCLKTGDVQRAEQLYRQILKRSPDDVLAWKNLGNALLKQARFAEAITCYQQALTLDPTYAVASYNLGVVFHEQRQYTEAIVHYQHAIQLDPTDAAPHVNLAVILEEQGRFAASLLHYQQAATLDPECAEIHWNQALILLRQGDWQHGWEKYEWRWRLSDARVRSFPQPRWDGTELNGKTILLYTEQGFGDTIQFIRYAPLVVQRGGRVIVECPAPLLRLLGTMTEIEQLIPMGDELPAFDVQLPLLSLPQLLDTTPTTIPAAVPYLFPPDTTDVTLKTDPNTRLKVGLVWSGKLSYEKNHYRSFSVDLFSELFNVPGVAFYSLQKGDPESQLTALPSHLPLQNLSPQLQDFADTAAAIEQLDLVITVDTSVAHLAGALGRPVWVLLAYVADWRWFLDRPDSPWYPTMRLFRQASPGDWAGVMTQVKAALKVLRRAEYEA